MNWHNIKFPIIILAPFLLCCSCTSEYTTVIRNDSISDISAELSGGNGNNINSEPAYGILLDSCCKADDTNGKLKIKCRIKPGEEIWLGQDIKLFDLFPPFDWGTVIVETADRKRTVITSWNLAFLTSEERRPAGCGDCGPPRVADVISIK